MIDRPLRVAYFPDSFHEVNGVAHTSQNFEAFARRSKLPFLCVRAGDRAQAVTEDGEVWTSSFLAAFCHSHSRRIFASIRLSFAIFL